MQSFTWMLVFIGATPVVISIASLAVGLWGLAKKQPLFISQRPIYWFLVTVSIVGIFLVIVMILTAGRDSSSSVLCSSVLEVAVFLVMIIAMDRQMTGYMILGVTDEPFRAALLYALNKMNLSYEETISRIKLTGLGADLVATVEPWTGMARILIRQREHAHYSGEIVTHMKAYFRDNQVRVNNTGFVLYLLSGVVLISILIFILSDINLY